MTAAQPAHHQPATNVRLVEFNADDLRARLAEALGVYVAAMGYPPGTEQQRAPMWLSHMLRPGWRCVVALDESDRIAAIGYGYDGMNGQWWHEHVRRGLLHTTGPAAAESWTADYFELTELHVRPDAQGRGTGERVLRQLLSQVRTQHVLLSTPEGESRAWRLYRRVGFVDVLRNYLFTGDTRPFAVLGRSLPLEDLGRT
jgi:ribosomal protein S18 acetylase RimI-like enzyme